MGYHGRRYFGHKALQRGVSCAEHTDAALVQSQQHGLRVEVFSCVTAREEPWVGSHAAAGSEVGPVVQVVFEHAGEGVGHRDGFGPKGYPDLIIGDVDGRGLQCGDPHKRLGVEQQQGASDAVGKGFYVAGQELFGPCQPLILGEQTGAFRLLGIEVDSGVEFGFLRPYDEAADLGAGRGTGG
jgi:hypothetical protein